MPSDSTRRSGRIPKQVAITLIGSDIEGRVFSERTKTVVLSRFGAGIISSFKLSPEQELVVRNEESRTEIEGRVVGQIGSEGDTYIYGVAFPDREVNFWAIEFPDLSETEKRASQTLLECSNCRAREIADHSDLASDVMAINESIVRYCQKCGSSTLWKVPISDGQTDMPGLPIEDDGQARKPPEEHLEPGMGFPEGRRTEPPVAPALWRGGKRPDVAPQRSQTFAGAAWTETAAHQPDKESVARTGPNPTDAENDTLPTLYPKGAPKAESVRSKASGPGSALNKQENRRKHVRTRVNLRACVRRPGQPDEVVACEDMSRGGLRFKSTKRYVEKMLIEVAVPYSPGDQAIFVPAQIAYVQELPEQKKYRCGIAYLRAGK